MLEGRAAAPASLAAVAPAWAVTALPYLVLLAPFLVARIPPLVDYPNHLARFWLIGGGAGHGPATQFWGLDWNLAATNVGVDRMVELLSGLAPPTAVAHTALIASVLLTPAGAAALNGALFRRASAWQAMLPLAAWPATLLLGFLNFQLGMGLALAFAAADAAASRRSVVAGVALRILFAAVLIEVHLIDLVFYAALVAAAGFGMEGLERRAWRAALPRLWRAAAAAAWCAVPLSAYLAFASALPAVGGAQAMHFGAVGAKLRALAAPLIGYDLLSDLALALCAGALVIALLRRGRLQAHAGLMVAAAGFLALAILAPDEVGDSSWLDARFAVMSLLCLLTGLSLNPETPAREARAAMLAAVALVSARTLGVAWSWARMEPDLAATEQVIAELPVGARVLPLAHKPTTAQRLGAPVGRYLFGVGDATFVHYGLRATPLRQAFVPTLFALKGKQPVEVRPRWAPCSASDGGHLTSVNALGRRPGPKDPAYLNRWRACFDYILVLNADLPDAGGPFRAPPGVSLVADRGFAQLWRIAPR